MWCQGQHWPNFRWIRHTWDLVQLDYGLLMEDAERWSGILRYKFVPTLLTYYSSIDALPKRRWIPADLDKRTIRVRTLPSLSSFAWSNHSLPRVGGCHGLINMSGRRGGKTEFRIQNERSLRVWLMNSFLCIPRFRKGGSSMLTISHGLPHVNMMPWMKREANPFTWGERRPRTSTRRLHHF